MDNLIFFSDLFRFVLVSVAAILIGVAARVILQYYRAARYAMRMGDFRGILPTHVWLITTSYVLLVVGSMIYHITHLERSPDVYLAIDGAAYATGAIALWLILRFESRRVEEGQLADRRSDIDRRLADLTTGEFKIERGERQRRMSDRLGNYHDDPTDEENEDATE